MGRGRGPNTADSYIGSLISLTSKSEIRYEGILYTVDTENSNIALQNVRSFGTEGRKKDGPQIPASDKVYDYIIFRGSDIKDLQVKSSPPLQPPPPPQPPTDPAIISLQSQTQYPPPSSIGSSYNGGLPSVGSSSDTNAPPPYSGMPPSAFRGGVPSLYPSAGMGSWGPPPPPPGANGTGLAMPMYWQGYYRPPTGHLQQQPLPPQPPPSLAPPPSHQQLPPQPLQPLHQQVQQVARPSGLIAGPPPAAAPVMAVAQPQLPSPSAASVAAVAAPAPSAPVTTSPQGSVASSAATSATPSSAATVSSVPVSAATSVASSVQGGVSAVITPAAKTPRRIVGPMHPAQPPAQQSVGNSSQGTTQTTSTTTVPSSAAVARPQTTISQLPGVLSAPSKTLASSSQTLPKLEQKNSEPAKVAGQPMISTSAQPPQQQQVTQPLLPLPSSQQKQPLQGNGATGNNNYMRRGRGRGSGSGRGIGLTHPTQHFTEDFDFTAMNEKFKKDEVWGELGGKSEKGGDDEDDFADGNLEDDTSDVPPLNKALPEAPKKAVYVKDDFFDSLSCDALDREEGRAERTKFSEQRKIDTETFGNFPLRSRGGRGGRGGGRRGGYRGGYYGGGYMGGGRGNGYGRGRGTSRSTTAIN